jgi:N-methylhydantoinase B/oxoprolinase/acetone carboxylase alpha subunit
MSVSVNRVDPVTRAVVRGYLESTCREMGTSLTRNAISPIFIEGQDFSCAIVDRGRELVAAANYDPSHLCSMAYAADWGCLELGADAIGPEDVVILNDPYRGGTHLPDVTMFAPVDVDGIRVAYVVTRAHHLDVGGIAPGSIPGGAREVFAEGLRIPPVRWQREGREDPAVVEFILTNVRLPEVQLSDFRAQAASLRTGTERIRRLCAKYGVQTIIAAMDALKDASEVAMRAFLRTIPPGVYRFTDYMDGDGNTPDAYAITARIDVGDGEAFVDFSGTSAQADGAINLPYAMTASSVFNAFLQLAGTGLAFNHGCFRPIRFHAPRGSLVNAQPPAPTFGCTTDTPLRVIDVIGGALAPALPGRAIAGSYGTCNCLAGSGTGGDGMPFLFWFFYEGGWGAARGRDGWNATPNQSANFRDYPVEILETAYPLRCDWRGLVPDSGGAGRTRGGLGTVHQFTFLAETILSGFGDRHRVRPYGLEGGQPGGGNRFLFRRAGVTDWAGIEEVVGDPAKFSGLIARPGDAIRIVNGGGGGMGNPAERPAAALRADLAEGLVSPAAARDAYQGVLDDVEVEAAGSDQAAVAIPTLVALVPVVDARTYPTLIGSIRQAPAASSLPLRAARARDDVGGVCRESCPLGADPLRCPYWHPDALRFWSATALRRWTAANCPASSSLLPVVSE